MIPQPGPTASLRQLLSPRDARRCDHRRDGAPGTALLLIRDRRPEPISQTVEQELAQHAGER
jgi:hypothetical protein